MLLQLAERRYANKEKKMAVKYHKIKFFERKKVTRQMQKAKKTLETVSRVCHDSCKINRLRS